MIFDQGLGDLFIIRNAGNIVDTAVLASAEYAVHYLKTNLIVVLGHTHCGAITAAVDHVGENRDNPDDLLELLRRLNDSIQPLEDAQPRSKRSDAWERSTTCDSVSKR